MAMERALTLRCAGVWSNAPSSMSHTDAGMSMRSNPENANASSPISRSPSWRSQRFMPSHEKKAFAPMHSTDAGISMRSKPDLANAKSPISVKPAGRFTFPSEEHSSNACLPIQTTVSGRRTDSTSPRPRNTSGASSRTTCPSNSSGISTQGDDDAHATTLAPPSGRSA